MSGLFLIGVVIIWLLIAVAITLWIARRFKSSAMKIVSAVVAFPILLMAPLTDELIGKQQFESLCKQYAVQVIDVCHRCRSWDNGIFTIPNFPTPVPTHAGTNARAAKFLLAAQPSKIVGRRA